MKRKLIDIEDSTFEVLSHAATTSATNLKRYIEKLLDEKAYILNDVETSGYCFSMDREPSDSELDAIMKSAAESAERKNRQATSCFFENLRKSVRDL